MDRERFVLQELGAPAQELRVGGRGEAERRAVFVGAAEREPGAGAEVAGLVAETEALVGGLLHRVGARVAGLTVAQLRTLHVRIVHGEMLLDHTVHRHS